MSFMQPQIEETTADHIQPTDEDIVISNCGRLGSKYQTNCNNFNDEYDDFNVLIEELRAAINGFHVNIWYQDDHGGMNLQTDVDYKFEGYSWRLSAPGYIDCTNWTNCNSLYDAIRSCVETYGDEFDCEDWRCIYEHFVENNIT